LTGYPNECLDSPAFPCSTSHTFAEYGFNGLHKFGNDNADVGLVILDDPITLDTYASLAAAGSVDTLHVGAPVTITGYGVSDEKPAVVSFRKRLMEKNLQCAGQSFAYRTDQQAVLDWIVSNADGSVSIVTLP
jgi:hypothetical protein